MSSGKLNVQIDRGTVADAFNFYAPADLIDLVHPFKWRGAPKSAVL